MVISAGSFLDGFHRGTVERYWQSYRPGAVSLNKKTPPRRVAQWYSFSYGVPFRLFPDAHAFCWRSLSAGLGGLQSDGLFRVWPSATAAQRAADTSQHCVVRLRNRLHRLAHRTFVPGLRRPAFGDVMRLIHPTVAVVAAHCLWPRSGVLETLKRQCSGRCRKTQ